MVDISYLVKECPRLRGRWKLRFLERRMAEMPFLKRIEEHRDEKGLTLVEVVAALFLLALISVGILAMFSNSGVWISSARQKSVASGYAADLIEAVREYSLEIRDMGIDSDDVWSVSDSDTSDTTFAWVMNGQTVSVTAPKNVAAVIRISKFDESHYYDSISREGVPKIGSDDVYFYGNMYQVFVDIGYGTGGGRSYSLSTIIGAR